MEFTHQVQEFDWEEMLCSIAEKRVIPIVGKELLRIPIDGQDVLLEQYLAKSLAKKLEIPENILPPEFDLNAIAMAYQRIGGDRKKVYSRIKVILDEREIPVPESLAKLAAIDEFGIYVSTTFDSLLLKGINEQRFQSKERTGCLTYSTSREIEDLPTSMSLLPVPYIFYLFGQASSTTDYAVTDEDHLEFIHSLQTESRRPNRLFDEFRENHLLFIGCGLADWLERFLIRTIRNVRLLNPRSGSEHVADQHVRQDQSLILFLQQYKTDLFLEGDPNQFVKELYDRWKKQHPAIEQPQAIPQAERRMEAGAIFVSYASEDREYAENMYKALKQANLDVWFDRNPTELEPGAHWERVISQNIQHCAVFIPFISSNAQSRREGFFRKEWNWAIKRDEGMDKSLRFIQPVVTDDIPDDAEGINEHFWKCQVMHFPAGIPTPEFVDQLTELVRAMRVRLRDQGG